MFIQHRIALALSASALVFALSFAPSAMAMDAMSKGAMHKSMKKHKGGMMKDGMMKSDHMMKSDGTAK